MRDELAAVIESHRAGRLRDAAVGYATVLTKNPDDPEALHLFGVLHHQQGDHNAAIERIGRAIALRPNVARYHANLAEAYRALGQHDRALGCCRTAVRLSPDYPEAHSNLGLALQALGKGEEAIAAYRRAIELRPQFAAARNNFGNALRELGRMDEALIEFGKAVEADPNYPPARTNLGQLLLDQGRAEEALPHAQAAIRLQPDLAIFHHNLANVRRQLGQPTEASAAYLEALRIDPDLATAQTQLGLLLQEQGRLDDALHWLSLAAETKPDVPLHWENLAALFEEREEYSRAIPCWERLLAMNPDRAEIHSALGWALQEDGQLTRAGEHFREALRLQPDLTRAKVNLGGLLEELGDLAGAEATFREALRDQPRFALPHARLGALLRERMPAEDLAALAARLKDADLGPGPRARLLFAFAQVRDGQRDFAGAADASREANALVVEANRGRREYQPADHELFVNRLIEQFDAKYFQRTARLGSNSRRPVFVFGLPRSGTTLIEQILASHPQAHGAGELSFARRMLDGLPQLLSCPGLAMESTRHLDSTTIPKLANEYCARLATLDGGNAEHIVDKMPDNYLYLGLLATLFPNAIYINCRRNLRDIAVSCWMTDFRSIRWANHFDHIASRFQQYRRLMAHWERVLPVHVHTVDYEMAVTDLDATVRRLLSTCGLPWDPACVVFHQSRRPVRTASVTQVRQPVYTRSVERWRNYAAPLAPLFAALPDSEFAPPAQLG